MSDIDNYELKLDLARLRKIAEQRTKDQELRNSIKNNNPDSRFDVETLYRFEQFADELLTLYKDILPREEIINRLKANVKEIILDDPEVPENADGCFFTEKHKVGVKWGKSEEEIKAILFHELFHTLVESNPLEDIKSSAHIDYENGYPGDSFDPPYKESNAIVETITTIAQEDFEREILGKNERRVNGYIPVYARQLRAIFGNDLIYNYVRNYKRLGPLLKLFYGNQNCIIDIDELTSLMDQLYDATSKKQLTTVNVYNTAIEYNLTFLLRNYFQQNPNLSDEEKLNIIESFIKEATEIHFTMINRIIDKTIRDKSLIKNYKTTYYVYCECNGFQESFKEVYGRDYDLDKKRQMFDFREFFGVNDTYYNRNRKILTVSENLITFEKHRQLFEALHYLHINKYLDASELNITSVKGLSSKRVDSKTYGKLKHGFTEKDFVQLDLINAIVVPPTAYKIKNNDEEFYVINEDVRRPMSIADAIEYYSDLMKISPDEAQGYRLGIETLNKIKDKNITTVYIGEQGIICEEGDIINSTFISFGDSSMPASVSNEIYVLEDLNISFIKNSKNLT